MQTRIPDTYGPGRPITFQCNCIAIKCASACQFIIALCIECWRRQYESHLCTHLLGIYWIELCYGRTWTGIIGAYQAETFLPKGLTKKRPLTMCDWFGMRWVRDFHFRASRTSSAAIPDKAIQIFYGYRRHCARLLISTTHTHTRGHNRRL